MAEIQDSDRGKAERLLFALSEFVYLHEKIEDDLFVAYTECITSKAETIDLEILNDSSDKWVQDAREETDRYRSDDYHIKYPCLKIQLLHHWYLFAGFALEDARNLLLSYSPTTPQIAEKEIQNIFQLINVIFKDFKELIALLKSSYILSNKEKKLAISIIEKRNNRLKNRALIYKIICNLGLQELAGQEQHASQDNGDDDGAADVLLRDGQLITNDIKESNPISCRLFELYEFIYMLCEFSRMRIDDKGRPQSPMIVDKSGEETPGVPWMLNEVQQGFEITDNYLTQHCPSLRDVITEAKNIFYLMCDKKKRVDEMLSIKGCDPDNVRLNLFKDMARLAVELEKAASPILVKANEYKGKPFTETITQVDKEIKSVKKSDSTPLNCNIQDNIFDRGPEIATPVINEKDSFENSPKCAYISDLYRACDELRIKISRPYHDNKWKTDQDALSSLTGYVKWVGESSLKTWALIEYGIKEYDCQIAKSSKLIVSAINVFSNATLCNIERFKQTYSDDKQIFEDHGTTAIETIEHIRKRFIEDINLFSKDLLLAEAQLATIDGNKQDGTEYQKDEINIATPEDLVSPDNKGSGEDCRHSDDFLSVVWYGQPYTFNKTQAQCIKVLWEEWEKGCPLISEKTIGDKIGSCSDNYRLINTFRSKSKMHPAWDTMIQGGQGKYRLEKPPQKKSKKNK